MYHRLPYGIFIARRSQRGATLYEPSRGSKHNSLSSRCTPCPVASRSAITLSLLSFFILLPRRISRYGKRAPFDVSCRLLGYPPHSSPLPALPFFLFIPLRPTEPEPPSLIFDLQRKLGEVEAEPLNGISRDVFPMPYRAQSAIVCVRSTRRGGGRRVTSDTIGKVLGDLQLALINERYL